MRGTHIDVKGGYYASPTPHPLTLMDGLPVKLAGTEFEIVVSQQYRVIENPDPDESWQVRTVAYAYALREADGLEIVAYHWHPTVAHSVSFPHLHIEHGAQCEREEFAKAHLPTGRVPLEDFVRMLIEDFHVPPEKENWAEELAESRAEFQADRSW